MATASLGVGAPREDRIARLYVLEPTRLNAPAGFVTLLSELFRGTIAPPVGASREDRGPGRRERLFGRPP
jgi:hypothetical protein